MALKFLIIGDSLTNPDTTNYLNYAPAKAESPGQYLAGKLIEQGHTVRLYAKRGRSAYSLIKEGGLAILKSELLSYSPNIVVVFLGTNDADYSLSTTVAAHEKLKTALKGFTVLYISLPYITAGSYISNGTKQNAELAKIYPVMFDSFPITTDLVGSTYRTSDTIHFKDAGARVYGERLAALILSYLRAKKITASIGIGATIGAGIALVAAVIS